MTHPFSVPEPPPTAGPVPPRPGSPVTPRWAPSAAEPTVQLPVAEPTVQLPAAEPTVQLPAAGSARPAWVPLAGPVEPRPAPAPVGYPTPYGLEPRGWDRPPANPYETAAPVSWTPRPDPRQLAYTQGLYAAQKSRVAAGVLGLTLGVFGVHNFYLGRSGVAVLQLLLTVLSLGLLAPLVWLWSVLEGILILVGSPSFAADRRGIPLR